MEFLQRHLPRVYQAVQSALVYITNVTAQIFGAPPNAPQPRNAQAKAPLRSEDTAAPEDTPPSQGADHMTLAPDVLLEDAALEATEESMAIYGIPQDVEIQAQETRVRHRKENVDRRVLDLHHTVSDGKDIFSHHQVSIDEHKDQSHSKVTTDDLKSTKPEEKDKIPCSVMSDVLHTEDQTIVNEEIQKVGQEAMLLEVHTEIKNEEKSSTLTIDNLLKDLEPKGCQENEVPPTRNQVLRSDLNSEIEENFCSTVDKDQSHSKVTTDDLKSTKPEDIDTILCSVMREVLQSKDQIIINTEDHTIINEEIQKVGQEAMLCDVHTEIKNEEKSSTLTLDNFLKDLEPKRCQENEVPPTRNKVLRSHLNSEIEENSCSTGDTIVSPSLEKTVIIEEVSEGASICHATVTSQKVDQESTECVPAPVIVEYDDLDIPDIKQQHKKLVTPISAADRSPCDQGEEARKTWEHLQETAVRLAMHCSLPQDGDQEFETLQTGEITKAGIVHEMHSSRPDQQEDNQELLGVTSHDPKVVKELSSEEAEQLEEADVFSLSGENDQHKRDQNVVKTRRRVHFSPSTEERDQMISITSEDTVSIKIDLIQEGELEPTTEHTGHPPNSHPRPEPNDKENDLGFICSTQDTEPLLIDPTTLEDQVNPLDMGHTVWYDELEITTDKEMFESIVDMSYHSVSLGLQPEETIIAIPNKKSPKEVSKDVPSVEEMQDREQGPANNTMSTLPDITTYLGTDCEMEYRHGEDPWSFNKVAGSLEKSSGIVSEHESQKGSYFADHEVTPITLDVLSQSSEAIRLDLLLNEDTELLKEQARGEGVSENTDGKENLLGLWHHPSMEEAEDTTKGELTSMTDEFSTQSSVSRLQDEHHRPSENKALVYIPGEGYSQMSIQDCDTSKNEQLHGDIISTESVKCLSTDPANIDKVNTAEHLAKAEDNEESVGKNIPMRNETQQEDLAGKESKDVDVAKEVKLVSKQTEEHVSVKEEDLLEEIKDYTWYRQDSYPNDGLIIYSDSNEDPGSQKDQTPTENTEESSEELHYKDHESEVMSKYGEAKQTHPQVSDSDEVNHLYIASEAEPTNTGLSAYPEDAFESEDALEGFCTHPTGFDLLSEIHSVINKSPSEKDVSEVMERSEVTYSAISGRNTEIESTEPLESGFQTDQVIEDLDLQCMPTPGHPTDTIPEDLTQENQSSVTPGEALGDQSLDSVKELEISLNILAVDQVETILDQNFREDSICKPQDGSDLLSEFNSVMSVDLPENVLEIVSTMNAGNSDKGMEDDVHFNKETNAEILTKITVEECSPGLHLSEGLGSLVEPTQTFQEEHYSSVGISVNETETEVSDIALVIGSTSVKTSEDGRAGDHSSVTLHEISRAHLGDQPVDPIKEQEIPLRTGSSAEDNIEVLVESILGSYSGAPDGGGDILPSVDPSAEDTVSTMNAEEIDEGHSKDEAIVGIFSETVHVEDHEEYYPKVCLSEEIESNTELEHTFEKHCYSSIVVIETEEEADDINNDFKTTETDPSLETHYNFIQDYTHEKLSQSKKESQSSKTLDDASTTQYEDLKVDKHVVPLENESLVEDIDLVLRFTSAVQGEDDLLSDINSVTMNSCPTEVIRIVSTCEEDILDTSKAREIQHEPAVQADILSDSVPGEQEKIHNNVCEEIVSSLQNSQTHEENQYSSSSQVSSEDSCIGLDIVSTSEGNGKVLLEDQEDKEVDPSAETHCSLITDHTVEIISESKDEEEESQPSEMLEDASGREFGDLKVNEPVILLEIGYHAEDIDVIFGSTSKLSQGEDDLSAKMTDHRTEVISLVSTTVEEDISDTSKVCDVMYESAVRVDILPDTAISDDQEKITNNVLAISSSEELGSILEPSQKLGEYEHSPSFPVSREESLIGSDIVNSVEENVQKEMDLLYEVQSAMTVDYLVGFTTSTTTVKVVASDAESEKEAFEETTQEFACLKPSEEPEKKLHEQDFSTVLTTGPHHTEDMTGFENNESLETTDYLASSGLEIQILPSMDHTKQTGMEGEGKENISSEEILCLGQNKHIITIHTEDPGQVIEPPTHREMSEDQERSVVVQKGTLMEPSVEEEDDIDNNLLPHNTLDISVQKSRVQLRRKTSIRRKQGQRQVTPESELVEPPQPASRPRPMGVAMFPGNLPVFPMASAMTSAASHSPEEPKEAKPAEEEFLIKPKKGIPKHAGFGIPHPQMMQELQARLKKKKPNE